MNTSVLKILFILIFSLAVSSSLAQEKPEARLIDEFGILGCEDIWARQDAFFVEIQNLPASVGYAVIYGKKDVVRQNLARERLIRGILEFRKFDKDRFVVVRGKESDEPHTKFWLVPAGADKPDFNEAKWDFTFTEKQKPFIFYASQEDIGPCPGGGDLQTYSEYLTANPKARANIVIYANSKKEFQKQQEEFLNALSAKFKISPKRIRFFHTKQSEYESYELWLLP